LSLDSEVRGVLPRTPFPVNFRIACDPGNEKRAVIDHQALKLMLAKFDSDIAYVLECINA
jgi:hypothetical protein